MISNNQLDFTEATLCFPIRSDEVLLAEKQKKIGSGLLNGFGGKVDADDRDIYATNVRETEEEIGIQVTSARKVGEITFHNPSKDQTLRHMIVHVFLATDWENEPRETDEMKKVAWYKISELDYNRFLAGDRLFMPQILGGYSVRGTIIYNDNWSVQSSDIKIVEDYYS